MPKNYVVAVFLGLVCLFASVAPGNAALVTVTVDFGPGGSVTTTATVNGGTGTNFDIAPGPDPSNVISDNYQSSLANITLTLSTASTVCAGSGGQCKLAGGSDGIPATVSSSGLGIRRSNNSGIDQIEEGDSLSLIFSGPYSEGITLTSLVLVNVDSDDGAVFSRVLPSGGFLLNDDQLSNASLTGSSYDATNGIYRTGLQSWAGTSFVLSAFGGADVNDFYLQSLSFTFEDTPEPATYALFAGGLLALIAGRKLRARRS